jgi:hypothetical protein
MWSMVAFRPSECAKSGCARNALLRGLGVKYHQTPRCVPTLARDIHPGKRLLMALSNSYHELEL